MDITPGELVFGLLTAVSLWAVFMFVVLLSKKE